MARVSVIVTHYNYGKYLARSLESVLNQDYPSENLEIILIDDASTDKMSRDFVKNYQHQRVRKILLKENVGVVRARNMAIEQARGEYILPLDADDYFAPDYVRLGALFLDENPDVGLTYAPGELIGDARGRWLGEFDIGHILTEGGTPSCSMFRKSAWQAIGGYHDYMKNGWEDWDFWLSLLQGGYVICPLKGTVGFYYRIKAHSRTKDAAEKKIEELWRGLFLHHQRLYFNYPQVLVRVLMQAKEGRKIARSLEYRLGYILTKTLRLLMGPLLPFLLRCRENLKKMKEG